MDEKRVKLAVRRFTQDPAMKKQYQSAPSTPARRLRELSFYFMWYDGFHAPRLTDEEVEECFAEMIRMQQKMTLIDWSYICKCTISKSFRELCRIHVELLQGQPVTLEMWQYVYDHAIETDPFRALAEEKIEELTRQG
ncbi:MAG: hypothetical protein LUE27_01775 [Clostridia bacterium]|nr:hypothetical protein [Clostridia bacterium]